MKNAKALILEAIRRAPKIVAAGKTSILGIAARALDPSTPLSREGISRTLGLHPSLVISVLVTSDLAGDTLSRQEMAESLIPRLPLRASAPELTAQGQIAVGTFCLEQLRPVISEIEELVERVLALAHAYLAGETPDPLALKEAESAALELQRSRVVPMQQGAKSRLGIADEEASRRRGSQSLRALLRGLQDKGQSTHLSTTVAGEVAATLATSKGIQAATDFCVKLACYLDSLPPQRCLRPSGN